MGGNRRYRAGFRAPAAVLAAAAAVALALAACGGSPSPTTTGEAGTGHAARVRVLRAAFPTRQRLGETTLLRIAVRNVGRRTIPALTVAITVGGKAGRDSALPFAERSSEPGLDYPDRPVWVLSAHYPRLAGSSKPAGAEVASQKLFDFGPLEPGATLRAVWQLTAVKAGRFGLDYRIGAGMEGQVAAVNPAGEVPRGSFAVRIAKQPPQQIVTDSGEVVTLPAGQSGAGRGRAPGASRPLPTS